MATRLFDLDVCLPELWKLIKDQLSSKQGTLIAGTGISIDEDGTISITLDNTLFKFVEVLPDKPDAEDENKIFVVPSDITSETNLYTEYYWTGTTWEEIGSFKADVDLSDYYKKEDVDSMLSALKTEIDEEISDVESSCKYTAGYGINISDENEISADYSIGTVDEIDEICQ